MPYEVAEVVIVVAIILIFIGMGVASYKVSIRKNSQGMPDEKMKNVLDELNKFEYPDVKESKLTGFYD